MNGASFLIKWLVPAFMDEYYLLLEKDKIQDQLYSYFPFL